jgi:hypothetical protein
VDRTQRYNQRLLREAAQEPRIIRSLEVMSGRRIRIDTVDWDEYWGYADDVAAEIEELKNAWTALILGKFATQWRCDFVRAYFSLLTRCLDCHSRDHHLLSLLRKVVGFETIRVFGDCGGSAAAVLNTRNPVYLLSKVANPRAPDNPKYLPLICPCDELSNAMYWHYRRIPLVRSGGGQLFVYPSAEVRDRSSSHALIGQLFACLTPRNDPWIRERAQSLYEAVFDDLATSSASTRVRLLDVACGSAKITLTLCKKASAAHRKSFDLTLVDVVRGSRSIANAFYRNPKVFGNLIFRRENLFDWVDKSVGNQKTRFDVALLLRACNLFSRFSVEKMPFSEAGALNREDRTSDRFNPQVLRPAELIDNNLLGSIEHGIGRFIFKNGWVFRQFSASDYFKAIHVVMGGSVSVDEDVIYVPHRAFDNRVLVLPSGHSLIDQLLTMANHLVIEDADMLPYHLESHFRQFALENVSIADLTGRAKRRGAAVYLLERKPADVEPTCFVGASGYVVAPMPSPENA